MRAPIKLLIENLFYESKISCASQCFDQNVIPILCSIHCLCRSKLWIYNCFCKSLLYLRHIVLGTPAICSLLFAFHSMLAITQSAPWLFIELYVLQPHLRKGPHARTQDYLPKHCDLNWTNVNPDFTAGFASDCILLLSSFLWPITVNLHPWTM